MQDNTKKTLTDAELLELATDFRKGILDGKPSINCGFIICAPLAGYLNFIGMPVKIIEQSFGWRRHCWLEMADGRILDPTADQFRYRLISLPPVYIGQLPEIYKEWMNEQ